MRIEVNGIRVFFDVEGARLVPDGPIMREKPTLILLHGGPGMDHSLFMPAFSKFADIAQVIYYDHRGNGRSDNGESTAWNVAQWGDDVRTFCDALEIEKPIVLGQSFGGVVALAYATRHPEHPGKLILVSTQARADTPRSLAVFERLGGSEARDAAARFFAGDLAAFADYARLCFPLDARRKPWGPEVLARCVQNVAVGMNYSGKAATVDLLPDLHRIVCPTLILAGEDDPIMPIESSEEMAATIAVNLVRLERYANTGHTLFEDEPRSFDAVREFILS